MIGGAGRGWPWAQAALLSVSLHGAAAAALIYRPSWNFTPLPTPQEMRLEVTTLSASQPEATTQTLTPVSTPDESVANVESVPIEPSAQEELAPLENELAALLQSDSAVPMVNLPELAPSSGQGDKEPLQLAGPEGEAEPTDPRLVELFDRIRDLLTQPCLLALPALRSDDQIQLGVMAASDREISRLMEQLTQGLTTEVTEVAILLDPRQCPALTFARRDPRYPVLGLGIQMETQDIAPGASMRGQISGGSGWYNSLLLVDDNGYVHDIRRYLIRSADRTRFDLPGARLTASRDTHQLLVAIATPERPETVSELAGESAEVFFDALTREVGQEAIVGVSSVYFQ